MRSRSLWSLFSAVLLASSAAQAGQLFIATWTQSIQSNDITVTNLGATCTESSPTVVLGTVICPTAGLQATGSATGTSYSVSLTMPLFSVSQITTGGAVAIHTTATQSGFQKIAGGAGPAAATMGVPGAVTIKLAAHVTMSNYAIANTTLLKLPLSVGEPGVHTSSFAVLTAPHYLTVDFYGWTAGSLVFTGLTSKYAPLDTPSVVVMGSFNLSPMGQGTVTLVSPSRVSIDGPLAQRRTVSFASLRLVFVPEPSTLLLLLSGAAGLGLAVRRGRSPG